MAVRSGDLFGDDKRNISTATCSPPLSDLIARSTSSFYRRCTKVFSRPHTHPTIYRGVHKVSPHLHVAYTSAAKIRSAADLVFAWVDSVSTTYTWPNQSSSVIATVMVSQLDPCPHVVVVTAWIALAFMPESMFCTSSKKKNRSTRPPHIITSILKASKVHTKTWRYTYVKHYSRTCTCTCKHKLDYKKLFVAVLERYLPGGVVCHNDACPREPVGFVGNRASTSNGASSTSSVPRPPQLHTS
jgi:hypothetical protein